MSLTTFLRMICVLFKCSFYCDTTTITVAIASYYTIMYDKYIRCEQCKNKTN